MIRLLGRRDSDFGCATPKGQGRFAEFPPRTLEQPKIEKHIWQARNTISTYSDQTTVKMATSFDNNSYDLIWETIRTFLPTLL